MKYLILCLVALTGLVFADNANATGRFRNRGNVNVRVEKQVVRGHNQANVIVKERIVADNHHHNNANAVVVQKVIAQPVYQDVVVEKVIVDNHGNKQRVRSVERIRVR